MGASRKQPNSRERGVCHSCEKIDALIASTLFEGLCPACYKREYARMNARRKGVGARDDLWTAQEDALLRAQYGRATRQAVCDALPGRSWWSIKHRWVKIGVKRTRSAEYQESIADEPARSPEYWRDWAATRQHAPTHPAIAELIAAEQRILKTIRRPQHGKAAV